MLKNIRAEYFLSTNPTEKRLELLAYYTEKFGLAPSFKVAESPLIASPEFQKQVFEASYSLLNQVTTKEMLTTGKNYVPQNVNLNGLSEQPELWALDFAICHNPESGYYPQLVELQAFPSVMFFQFVAEEAYKQVYQLPATWRASNPNYSLEDLKTLIKKEILGQYNAEEVVLLDNLPHKQRTYADLKITADYLGIKLLSVHEIIEEDGFLYYQTETKKQPIKRIFNRLILDEVENLTNSWLSKPLLHVEWVAHPAWFYKISKAQLPYLKGDFVPYTDFLENLSDNQLLNRLPHSVVKKIKGYASNGIMLNPTYTEIEHLNREEWLIQNKIDYAKLPLFYNEIKSKCELRMIFMQHNHEFIYVTNLVRQTTTELIGASKSNASINSGTSILYFNV